jgi:hypothetical protein
MGAPKKVPLVMPSVASSEGPLPRSGGPVLSAIPERRARDATHGEGPAQQGEAWPASNATRPVRSNPALARLTKEHANIMEPETAARRIHSYDVRSHRIACGVPGQMNSTKHPGGVNCPECLRMLAGERQRDSAEAESPAAPTTH